MTQVITGKNIEIYRLCVLRGRLKLEIQGLKFRVSTYALVKREFGFKGNRARVLQQLEERINERKS